MCFTPSRHVKNSSIESGLITSWGHAFGHSQSRYINADFLTWYIYGPRLSKMSKHFSFPKVLAKIIAEYVPTLQFLPWIIEQCQKRKWILKNNALRLWQNPNAIDMCLELNLPMSWSDLSANPSPWAIARLNQNPSKIDPLMGAKNPCLKLGDERHAGLDYKYNIRKHKYANPNAHLSLDIYFIPFNYLCLNPDDHAVDYLMEHIDDWKHMDQAWGNPNDRVFNFLIANREINWEYLSSNSHPDAIQLLRDNQEKINWEKLFANPKIFEMRYDIRIVNALSE